MGELSKAGTFLRNRFSGGTQSVSSVLFLDAETPISFALAFVVQSANFREMPAFVRLAEEVEADCVVFQRYYSFGHEGIGVFASKDVASPAHPEHQELQAILADPILMLGMRGGSDILGREDAEDRKSTRLNSSHQIISHAVFC